ncbi:hypothetical protein Scep_004775 [Stephania cephalantha]|uniref:TAFII28-like protein domain-containing protein n=1 Tax=Stephania cephalantha TaxID=152367 RepID=A0AAP0PZF7_9MAGN
MKQSSKDPFEAAFEEQQEQDEQYDSPSDSPIAADEGPVNPLTTADEEGTTTDQPSNLNRNPSASTSTAVPTNVAAGKGKEEDEEEEEENMDVELSKLSSNSDPDKMAKMQAILSQFTEEQMSRYESFRRSGFQKSNMKRLIAGIIGSPKISVPMTIVVNGIAKMFVGELIETARMVMNERKESGPIRPCHIREAHRRLKLEGKIPKRSVPRLFR